MAENPFTGQYSGQEVDLRKLWYMRCGMQAPNDRLVNHPPHPKFLHAGRMMPLTVENQDRAMSSAKQTGPMLPMPVDHAMSSAKQTGQMLPMPVDHAMSSSKQTGPMLPMPMDHAIIAMPVDVRHTQQTNVGGSFPPNAPDPDRLVVSDKLSHQIPYVPGHRDDNSTFLPPGGASVTPEHDQRRPFPELPQNKARLLAQKLEQSEKFSEKQPTFLPPGGASITPEHDQRQQFPELPQKRVQSEKFPKRQDMKPKCEDEPKMPEKIETKLLPPNLATDRESEIPKLPVKEEKQEPVKDIQMARMSPLRIKLSDDGENHANGKRVKTKATVKATANTSKDQSKLPAKKRKKMDEKPVVVDKNDKDRNHICIECGRAFLRTEHLRRHKKIHTGERPHICNYCDKTFTRAEHLHRHLRIHTGEKPYDCEECGKAFTRMEHLRRHLRAHAEGKIPPAKECSEEVEAITVKKTKKKKVPTATLR